MSCLPCGVECLTCFGAGASQCLTCIDGTKLVEDGSCVLDCSAHRWLDIPNKKCLTCDVTCDACKGVLATDCTACPNTN